MEDKYKKGDLVFFKEKSRICTIKSGPISTNLGYGDAILYPIMYTDKRGNTITFYTSEKELVAVTRKDYPELFI